MRSLNRVKSSLQRQQRQIDELAARLPVLDRLNHLLPVLEQMNHLFANDSPGALDDALPSNAALRADAETVMAAVADLKATIRALGSTLDEVLVELRSANGS